MTSIREVLEIVANEAIRESDQWCLPTKAERLVSMVFAYEPRTVVELGVWMGGSLIPMALAMKAIGGERKIIGIDPWSPHASVDGQTPENASWWATAPHETAYQTVLERIRRHDLGDVCEIIRASSDDAPPPPTSLDLLHIDGNHGEQVRKDVERWAPRVTIGGYCIMDDIGWSGGHVLAASHYLHERLGFRMLYDLPPGVVLQRVSAP